MWDRPVYTVDDLATRWQTTRKTVLFALQEGRLHGFRVGKRHWRIPHAEVERYEQGKARTPA